MSDWFTVDKAGLAQLLERRGRAFIAAELISNSWDQKVTEVNVSLTQVHTVHQGYELRVEDDDPDGFADIRHAFTLFAPSAKKADAEKRGRFNLGEKLVLAFCREASITTTTTGVRFDADGRHQVRRRREKGSEFRALLKLAKADVEAIERLMRTLLPPAGVTTTYNGEVLAARQPEHEFSAQLDTEVSDDEGNLRPTRRWTTVRVYEPAPGEAPSVYELGIPVVEHGDRWHLDVGQKVPLNMDRDNVRPAFLRHLRTLVLNEMHDRIDVDDANATWAKEAIEDSRVKPEAVKAVITKRFGEKAVIYDPSDAEANNIAVTKGYTVIHGRQLSKVAWENVRRHDLLKPAGQVTPSPSKLLNDSFGPEGENITIDEAKWTSAQHRMVAYARKIGAALLGFEPDVAIVSDITIYAAAFYGGRRLALNVGKLGHRWFDQPDQHRVDALLIHEFAHEQVANHLDHAFHDECCRLGALLRDVHVRLDGSEHEA